MSDNIKKESDKRISYLRERLGHAVEKNKELIADKNNGIFKTKLHYRTHSDSDNSIDSKSFIREPRELEKRYPLNQTSTDIDENEIKNSPSFRYSRDSNTNSNLEDVLKNDTILSTPIPGKNDIPKLEKNQNTEIELMSETHNTNRKFLSNVDNIELTPRLIRSLTPLSGINQKRTHLGGINNNVNTKDPRVSMSQLSNSKISQIKKVLGNPVPLNYPKPNSMTYQSMSFHKDEDISHQESFLRDNKRKLTSFQKPIQTKWENILKRQRQNEQNQDIWGKNKGIEIHTLNDIENLPFGNNKEKDGLIKADNSLSENDSNSYVNLVNGSRRRIRSTNNLYKYDGHNDDQLSNISSRREKRQSIIQISGLEDTPVIRRLQNEMQINKRKIDILYETLQLHGDTTIPSKQQQVGEDSSACSTCNINNVSQTRVRCIYWTVLIIILIISNIIVFFICNI
ncbi:hypothetical protein TBLA_0B09780 [Henningerozyma blattae CBS 6284]|uniref:Uncharacterized protein n=1 Tax=Henningerozyma blattae (strain ATCC 34711 / CBS 6284 / DSM 70876 / NBRC 10599 / NRRL Y-10934 / UCD 77-7) TaxID=1071380 RepID=I2H092_HENB6|nr:hypothetical protein TBLA_0B09780 [Tetrapisispora blattae CBS 6284]CCH59794.1 hypothetical protein TBLA_0B09780 [Tetrapisispora blattae CBS 6284]